MPCYFSCTCGIFPQLATHLMGRGGLGGAGASLDLAIRQMFK